MIHDNSPTPPQQGKRQGRGEERDCEETTHEDTFEDIFTHDKPTFDVS